MFKYPRDVNSDTISLDTLSVKLYQTYNFISLEDPLLHFIRREGDIHR